MKTKNNKRYAPIPPSHVISNKYYDLKQSGKAGRRVRKIELKKEVDKL